jgi:hypothetical protein
VTLRTARRRPRNERQRNLLAGQEYLCFYCTIPFGSVVSKRGRFVLTVVNYDHVLPFALLNANPDGNWVAACQICNQIKGSHVFQSIPEAREHVLEVRTKRRLQVEWLAPFSSEEYPERWAISFSGYLARLPIGLTVGEEVPTEDPEEDDSNG